MISSNDFREVPADLIEGNRAIRRFHQWKAAATVQACVPIRRMFAPPRAGCPGILMYHRVVPNCRRSQPTWNVAPDRFRSQLAGLLQSGYQPWPLSRLISTWEAEKEFPDNIFVVTFDDGYANNLLYALPALQELHIPATVFLATAYVGSPAPFPFDDWKDKGAADVCSDTWRALTKGECHQMLSSELIEFGSHTHTHEDFRDRPEMFREDVERSIEFLNREFGITNPTLSLPYGILAEGFAGPAYFTSAEQLGTRCCLTTEEEVIVPNSSPFGWGRFIAEQHDTASTLAVKLDGWRDAARNGWRRLRGLSR